MATAVKIVILHAKHARLLQTLIVSLVFRKIGLLLIMVPANFVQIKYP